MAKKKYPLFIVIELESFLELKTRKKVFYELSENEYLVILDTNILRLLLKRQLRLESDGSKVWYLPFLLPWQRIAIIKKLNIWAQVILIKLVCSLANRKLVVVVNLKWHAYFKNLAHRIYLFCPDLNYLLRNRRLEEIEKLRILAIQADKVFTGSGADTKKMKLFNNHVSEMRLLGSGHKSVVISGTKPNLVYKYYATVKEANREYHVLKFLKYLSSTKGLNYWPVAYSRQKGRFYINKELFRARTEMSRMPGMLMSQVNTDSTFVANLAKVIVSIQFLTTTRDSLTREWIRRQKDRDQLLAHLVNDKAKLVLDCGGDKKMKVAMQEVVGYLTDKMVAFKKERVLTHLDLQPTNIMVAESNKVAGLVDWGDFGLTHPSLSLYQLVDLRLWKIFKEKYESLAFPIRHDFLYGATMIHLAWISIRHLQLGLNPDIKGNEVKYWQYYQKFRQFRQDQ